MRLDKILIGIGIFVLFITVGLGVMFGDRNNEGVFDDYDVNASDSNFQNLTRNINEVYDIGSKIKEDMTEEDIESATSWENLISGGYKALRSYLSTFSIAGSLIYAIGKTIGIPPVFMQFAMASLLITVIFTLLYMVFRFMPRD